MAELEALQPGARHLAFLAKLLAIPLEESLRLKWQDIIGTDCATLRCCDGAIISPKPLASQIAKLVSNSIDITTVLQFARPALIQLLIGCTGLIAP